MRPALLFVLGIGIIALASCATPRTSLVSAPVLEVQQVPHHWELIVRLFDEPGVGTQLQCGIYRVLEDDDGANPIEAKVADLLLSRNGPNDPFIGVYANEKEFPHGTKIVAICRYSKSDQLLRGSTRMYYH